jgi:hypothetical protein
MKKINRTEFKIRKIIAKSYREIIKKVFIV